MKIMWKYMTLITQSYYILFFWSSWRFFTFFFIFSLNGLKIHYAETKINCWMIVINVIHKQFFSEVIFFLYVISFKMFSPHIAITVLVLFLLYKVVFYLFVSKINQTWMESSDYYAPTKVNGFLPIAWGRDVCLTNSTQEDDLMGKFIYYGLSKQLNQRDLKALQWNSFLHFVLHVFLMINAKIPFIIRHFCFDLKHIL